MSKLRFLINPIGSHGDVDPLLAIGKELQNRGHEVFVLTNAIYRKHVESLGMRFIRIGKRQDMRRVGTDPRIHQMRHAWKLALKWAATDRMRETYEQIKRLHVKGRTVVAAAITSFGARIANERLGIPLATILIDPDKLRGLDYSPVVPPLVLSNWVPRSLKQLQYWIADRLVIDPIVAPTTNQFRKELELPPVGRLLDHWWFSPELVIGLFDEWFVPRSADWPANVHLVGPALWNPPSEVSQSEEIMEFVRDGSPPLAFIAGSAGPTCNRFFRVAKESAIELGRRAIFLHNNPRVIPGQLPETIRYFKYYSPLYSLLAECCSLVHHAGTGTAFHALAAGIPQLVSPQAFDQPDIAMRLRRLQVARVLEPKKFTTPRVTSQLSSLLGDTALQTRCGSIAKRFVDRHSAGTASDLLEKLCPPQQP